MTSKRRKTENVIETIFTDYLRKTVKEKFQLLPDQTDRPDMGIVLEGAKIGIKFVHYELEQVMKFEKTIPVSVDRIRTHVLQYYAEGDRAMKRILGMKSVKCKSYEDKGFSYNWLVCHADHFSLADIREDGPFFIETAWKAALAMSSPFERIFFLSKNDKIVTKIYERGQPIPISGRVQFGPIYVTTAIVE